jgi:hypothetical protein
LADRAISAGRIAGVAQRNGGDNQDGSNSCRTSRRYSDFRQAIVAAVIETGTTGLKSDTYAHHCFGSCSSTPPGQEVAAARSYVRGRARNRARRPKRSSRRYCASRSGPRRPRRFDDGAASTPPCPRDWRLARSAGPSAWAKADPT